MWLEHLLLLSMLQHGSRAWSWGRYVVVRAAGNSDFADAVDRYAGLLADRSTFGDTTIEALLDSGLLPSEPTLRERYLG